MSDIHEPTGLPILDKPRPDNENDVAKMEVWLNADNGLQVLLSIPAHLEEKAPGLVIKIAHAMVSKVLERSLGPASQKTGVDRASL